MNYLKLFLFSILFLPCAFYAQDLHQQALEIINTDPEKAFSIAQKEIKLSRNNTKERVYGLNDLGNAYYYLDEYDKGIEVLEQSAEMAKKISFSTGEAESHVISGNIYLLTGKFSNALQHFSDAEAIYLTIGDKNGLAQSYNGIGTIHFEEADYEKALSYFKKAVKNGNEVTKSDSYVNMSHIFLQLEAYTEAKNYAEKAYAIGLKNKDLYVQSYALDVIGQVWAKFKNYPKSTLNLQKSLALKKTLDDGQGKAATYYYIGLNFKNTGETDSAMLYTQNAYQEATLIGANEELKPILEELAKLHAIQGNFSDAFLFQTKYIELNNSLDSNKATKKIAELEMKMTRKLQEEQLNAIQRKREYEKKMNRIYLYSGIAVLILLGFVALSVFNRYRAKKRANEALEAKNIIIESQKHAIESKNNEIVDSITYAKRIQNAILPSNEVMQKHLPRSFVYYKPKDIIAGDFYWIEENENTLFFAVADCTGHGVPGALVSVVCHNAMNRSVREYKLSGPNEILNKTRELVIEQFRKSENDVKDGMDISLCAMQKSIDQTEILLEWSGANNPLWIVRNKDTDKLRAASGENYLSFHEPVLENEAFSLFEIKADKQPVGLHIAESSFTNWKIQILPGDSLYMFTDGYADQFGGAKGKKFLSRNLKNLILEIQAKTPMKKKNLLSETFNIFQGTQDQVDDVCIMGIDF